MRIELFGFRLELRRPRRDRKQAAKIPAKPDAEASEMFWSAFCGGSSIYGWCSCGRTVFASHTGFDYEEGELEELQAKAAADPEHYVENALDDGVSIIELPSGPVICGCPCRGALRHEKFLVGWRRQIMEYYRRLVESEQHRAAVHSAQLAAADLSHGAILGAK